MQKIRLTLAVTTVLAASVALAACTTTINSGATVPGMGQNGMMSGSASASAPHNDADVTFVTGMIPHHEQAVEMADVILGKTGINGDVVALATRIKAAQGPEITMMNSWMTGWGLSSGAAGTGMPGTGTPSPSDMGGMDMGAGAGMNGAGTPGTGMMSADDMNMLNSANGLDASKLFLQQMIQHHTGALEMARTETGAGMNSDVLGLAASITTSQTAEIAEMQKLLASL